MRSQIAKFNMFTKLSEIKVTIQQINIRETNAALSGGQGFIQWIALATLSTTGPVQVTINNNLLA